MNYCYLCGKELSDDGSGTTAKRHKEHIIHNGIYGRLKSSAILCETCGGKYSGSDAKFVELFKGFIDLMSPFLYGKDHGSEERKRIKAYLYPIEGEKMEVEYHAGKTYPKVPYTIVDDEKKEVTLCANKHRLKDFEKVVLKEHPEYENYTIIHKDDVTDGAQIGLFFSEQNPDFNKIFKEGIAKIAIEFALHSGVDRADIPEILRVQKDGTCVFDPINAAMIPYTPHSSADILVTLAEDMVDVNYPCHILRLFVDEGEDYRMLVCYVDLFSTFRYYIVLNRNYDGPEVSNDYAQRIIAGQDEDGNALRPEFELGDSLKKTCGNLIKIINDFYNTGKLPDYMLDKKTFETLLGTMVADEGIEQVIKEIVDCLSIEHYVKHVVYHYDDVEPSVLSAPGKCLDTTEDDLDKVREYTNMKFMQLNRFCWNVGIFMAEKYSR